MSSPNRKRSPVKVRSPLPDIPRTAAKSSFFHRRDSLTSTLSARSKAYRDTLRMPAMVPAPEDDDNNSHVVDGQSVSATLNSVNIKKTYKERYMETDAAKANAKIGLPEVRIKPRKQLLPQPSSPKSNLGSIFGSVFSKHSSKGYSIENLTQAGHKNIPDLISSPKLLQQRHVMRLSDLENDGSDEMMINPTAEEAKNNKGLRKRHICLLLFAIVIILAVAGVTTALLQTNLKGDGKGLNDGNGVLTPTASPLFSVPTLSPLTSLPTKSPTKKPTFAPTRAPTPKPTFAPTKSPTKKPTLAPTPAPSVGSITVNDAEDICDEADPNTLICLNSATFFTCGSNGSPVTQGISVFRSVVLNGCPEGTSCACTPLTQSISLPSSICTAANSGLCEDLS